MTLEELTFCLYWDTYLLYDVFEKLDLFDQYLPGLDWLNEYM